MIMPEVFGRAVAAHRGGSLVEARRLYQAIIAAKPDHFDALHLLGILEHQLGHHAKSCRLIARALQIVPDYAEAHYNCGNALHALRRHREALASYDRAIALKPGYVKALNNRAVLLVALHRLRDALESCDTALAIDPSNTEALVNRGNVLMELGRLKDALATYDRAWAIKPSDPDVLNNKGNVLVQLGRLDEAADAFDEAIRRAPRNASAHFHRVQLRRFTADDPRLATLNKLADDIDSLPRNDQILLQFALAKVDADLGRREQGFTHLLKGNALQRLQMDYAEGPTLARFRRTQTVFTEELMRQKRGVGDPSRVPVFIVGMIRSGTTLIEQILASHPQVFGAGELRDFSDLTANLDASGSSGARFPEVVSFMSAAELRKLGADYVDRVSAIAPGASKIVDKMPPNFQLVGLIHLALPNARIIHARRGPIDTCLSCFAMKFTQGNPFAYDLGELGRYYHAYQQLMDHWRRVLPPDVMLEVQYEDIVADLEGQARRMISYCGLEWDASCLAFYKTQRSVRTASAIHVRQPIYRGSVGRWRPNDDVLRPLLDGINGGNSAATA